MKHLLACITFTLALAGVHAEGACKTWKDDCEGVSCVCYKEQGLGCFLNRTECADELPPDHPDDIATTFLLYDKLNEDEAVEITPSATEKDFRSYGFDPSKQNKFLIHGCWSPNFVGLLLWIKEELFAKKDYNIFAVNWESSNDVGSVDAKKIRQTYRAPSMRGRVVGVQLGKFLERLQNTFGGVTSESVHFIGYNVGAHVAGYAGKYMKQKGKPVARISALGPSAPYFEEENGDKKPAVCRLDKGDATFVDVIHTDLPSSKKITLGMKNPIGHVDFYPNDGKDNQPGCKHMFCSHARALEFYEQSIKSNTGCTFQSRPCEKDGKCPEGGCPVMGFTTKTDARGKYCVDVTDKAPFCVKKKPDQSKNTV